jgi:cytochrome c oxidase assembly protein subunit 15
LPTLSTQIDSIHNRDSVTTRDDLRNQKHRDVVKAGSIADTNSRDLPTVTHLASRWPQSFAIAMAVITFPLIWAGGLVTTTDAGMAVPDWPGTYGYNMFAYPWSTWFFGPWDLFIEHGHRLLGSLAGLVTIGFVMSLFMSERRRWLQLLGLVALLLVIAQGALGGVRVLADDRVIAKIHGCVGPAFFALSLMLVVFTSRFWRQADSQSVGPFTFGNVVFIRALTGMNLLVAYLQLIVGANLRHIAVDATPSLFRTLVWLHLGLAAGLIWSIWFTNAVVLQRKFSDLKIRSASTTLSLLVLVQVCLGVGTWLVQYGWPGLLSDAVQTAEFTIVSKGMLQTTITTAHVATGSLILAVTAYILVRAWRRLHVSRQQVLGKSHESVSEFPQKVISA